VSLEDALHTQNNCLSLINQLIFFILYLNQNDNIYEIYTNMIIIKIRHETNVRRYRITKILCLYN